MFNRISTFEGKEIVINYDQIVIIENGNLKMSNGDSIFISPELTQEIISVVIPPTRKEVKEAAKDDDLFEFFSELHTLTGGKGTPIFNGVRQKKLKDLLSKHKMTREQLIKAATNIGQDDFLQGKDGTNTKRYGDIDYLLRVDKAMKWAEVEPKKKKGMF